MFRAGDIVELREEYLLHTDYMLPVGAVLQVVNDGREVLDCDYVGENVIYELIVPIEKVKFVRHDKPYTSKRKERWWDLRSKFSRRSPAEL